MRQAIHDLQASKIREVANAGLGRDDVLAFWFGEPDRPTPRFIVDAAKAALDDGDTFYLPNLGMPALREALAGYVGRLHGGPRRGRFDGPPGAWVEDLLRLRERHRFDGFLVLFAGPDPLAQAGVFATDVAPALRSEGAR